MAHWEHREEPRWKDFRFNQPYAKGLAQILEGVEIPPGLGDAGHAAPRAGHAAPRAGSEATCGRREDVQGEEERRRDRAERLAPDLLLSLPYLFNLSKGGAREAPT
jgi:hypothetical protein